MAMTTFIGAESLIAFGLIRAFYAKRDYVTEPELHELARTLQACFNDNDINAIVQDASISYAIYGSDYFKKEKVNDESRYFLASKLTTIDDLRFRFMARYPIEVHTAIEAVISEERNKEIVSKLKSDLEKICGTLTYRFDEHEPIDDEMLGRVNEILDHYCGTDRKLTPEQLERFKQAASSEQSDTDGDNRPGVYKMLLYIDSNGCIRAAKNPATYVEINVDGGSKK